MIQRPSQLFVFSVLSLGLATACGKAGTTPIRPDDSEESDADAGDGDLNLGALGGASSELSSLPHPGPGGLARPSASGASNFKVLNWAGFQGAASYTFDDTQPSHFEHLEALKATGVRMTWYANPTSNWIAGYDSALRELVELGHELGNHTMSHCRADLTQCAGSPPLVPVGTAADEIDQATAYLEELGQDPVYTMAYPYGDAGWKELAAERFLLARGVGPGHILPLSATDPLVLPTVSAAAGDTAERFEAELSKAGTNGSWVIFLFHTVRPTANDWYAGVELSAIVDSISTGRASGEVWLDSVVRIGAYFLAQKLLTDAAVVSDGSAEVRTWTLPAHFPPGQYVRVVVSGGTLSQSDQELPWNNHGFYEVALDVGELTWRP